MRTPKDLRPSDLLEIAEVVSRSLMNYDGFWNEDIGWSCGSLDDIAAVLRKHDLINPPIHTPGTHPQRD